MDPLAWKYPNISPYAYCLNNPVRWIDSDGRDPRNPQHWVRFAKDLYKASTAVVSIGLQASANVDVSAAKLGVDVNAGVIDLLGVRDGVFTPNKNTPTITQGVDLSLGIVSFSTGTTTTDTGETTVTKDNISVSLSVFDFYETKTTETNQSTKESTTTIDNGVKASDIKVKAAAIFGIELGLDTEKAARALRDLLNPK
jgi:hypothetical protein